MGVFGNVQEGSRNFEMENEVINTEMLNDFIFYTLNSEVSSSSRASSSYNADFTPGQPGNDKVDENEMQASDEELFNAFINTDAISQNNVRDGFLREKKHGVSKQDLFGDNVVGEQNSYLDGEPMLRTRNSQNSLQAAVTNRPSLPLNGSSQDLSYYEKCEKLLNQQFMFGRTEPLLTAYLNPAEFLSVDAAQLPYKLTVSDMPARSRVETQIKLQLTVSPPPPQYLVHLPSDCITKQKLYLSGDANSLPKEIKKDLLFLEAFLICTSNNRATHVCTRCVKREQRRAARRKSGLSDNLIWCNNQNRRAVVFNSKQVFLIKQEDCTPASKSFSLSTRIVCYCRHHKEPEGFKLLFILRDAKGEILGKDVTSPIMIMDKKSTKCGSRDGLKEGESNSATDLSSLANKTAGESSTAPTSDLSGAESSNQAKTNLLQSDVILMNGGNMMFSPNSIADDSSEAAPVNDYVSQSTHPSQQAHHLPLATSSAAAQRVNGYKRKRVWPDVAFPISENPSPPRVPSDRSFSSVSQVPSTTHLDHLPQLQQNSAIASLFTPKLDRPFIQRVIPNQGPVKGGIEVTLLGSNFSPDDIVKFGENRALSTQCWCSTTIVTYLPPAATVGKVLVNVFAADDTEQDMVDAVAKSTSFFTYVDDTDRQLIELALQIVGLKMNGKLEDARNIAKRIVGSDSSPKDSSGNITPGSMSGQQQYGNQLYYSDEALLIKVIKLLNPGSNLSMCTPEGHTMLHLASLKGYYQLVGILVKKGARIEAEDRFGLTPLHFACTNGDIKTIELLIQCKASITAKAYNGLTPKDMFVTNHATDDKRYKLYFDDIIALLSGVEKGSGNNSDVLDGRRLLNSSSNWNSQDDVSITSTDDEYHQHGSEHVYESMPESSEVESSNYEEDGDESLLHNDENFDDNDFNQEHTSTGHMAGRGVPVVSYSTDNGTPKVRPLKQVENVEQAMQRPAGGQEGSLWNRMMNAFNDTPPKYEDLFPSSDKHDADSKLKATESVDSMVTTVSPAAPVSAEDSQSSSEDEDEALQARLNRFFQQRKNFQNDKMLLLFWLPLMIFLVASFIIARFGQEGNSVRHISKQATEYVMMGLMKFMVGNQRMKTLFKESFNNFQCRKVLKEVAAI
ncbi:HDR187Wp [Eremothecium sinecaudum]|uniref:HDR187Wp n=1 Tax=Eremothecium sinecaudum TaxID=45286 RepID=A0A0X8HT23_9SACH|nr:HDR187Wp [Eremothecium sinecaudum]AMD20929.1 HDR187Wp [Eremothecium sinecaudum]